MKRSRRQSARCNTVYADCHFPRWWRGEMPQSADRGCYGWLTLAATARVSLTTRIGGVRAHGRAASTSTKATLTARLPCQRKLNTETGKETLAAGAEPARSTCKYAQECCLGVFAKRLSPWDLQRARKVQRDFRLLDRIAPAPSHGSAAWRYDTHWINADGCVNKRCSIPRPCPVEVRQPGQDRPDLLVALCWSDVRTSRA